MGIGVNYKNSTANLDADVDFTQLQDQCPIIDVTFTWTKQHTGDKGSHTGCSDFWIYSFSANDLPKENSFYEGRDSYDFKSYEHEIRRECNSCNRCDQEEPRFEVGMESTCWRPSVADTSSSGLSGWYRCGNEDCIKILPPQEDEDRARNLAQLLFLLGVIILPVSIPLVIGAYFMYKYYCKKRKPTPWEESVNTVPPIYETSATTPSAYVPTNGSTSYSNQVYKSGSNTTGGKSIFDKLNNNDVQRAEA